MFTKMLKAIKVENYTEEAKKQYKNTTHIYTFSDNNDNIISIILVAKNDATSYIQALYGKHHRIGIFLKTVLSDIKSYSSMIFLYSDNPVILKMCIKLGFKPNMLSIKGDV